MPPTSKTVQEIPHRIRLLELAQRNPLYLSQDNQTYIDCPTAIPVYSEDFFTWLLCLAEKRLGTIPSPTDIARVARTLDSQARAAKTKEAVHIRIAKRGTKSYQIDLGTDDHQVVNITGQHWQLSQHFDTHFERIEDHKPITPPEPTANTLEACMETLFHLPTQIAGKLAIWLVEAMLPDRKPPMLVITGKAREQAVITLRNLIDPVFEPIIETPVNASELRRMSLENKVLAFSVNDQFSEKIIKGLNQFHEGKRVLLKHCQGSRIKLRSTISRPVIIATEEPQQISPTQFNLEINEAEDIFLGKVVAALLSLLVKIIGQPEEVRETRAMAEPGEIEATREPPSPDSS